ncbi:MAG: hypothetical protein AAB337_02730 [Patescibacteria group bacterium]
MNHKKTGASIAWMVLSCVALLLIFFFAGDRLPASILLPVLIGICVISHIWMMSRGHGSHGQNNVRDEKTQLNTDADKKGKDAGHHGGCCG